MKVTRGASVAIMAIVAGLAVANLAAAGTAQTAVEGPSGLTKIAVIDIERIAAESAEGKALFEQLKVENEKINQETQKLQEEIRDMQTKLNSEILSQDAKMRLSRDIEKKRKDAQRWVEDAQAAFEAKRQDGETKFQEKLAPMVEAVAKEHGIGLIFRATPGLTFVLDQSLDISALVVEKLDAAGAGTGDVGSGNPQ